MSAIITGGDAAKTIAVNGGIASTAVLVAMTLTEVLKPIAEATLVKDLTTSVHDSTIQLLALTLTIAVVVAMLWAFTGFADRAMAAAVVLDAFFAWSAEFGIYRQIRPIPTTPTDAYIKRASTLTP